MVVVMNLASRPRFFIGAAMGLVVRPRFYLIGMFIVGVGLGRADGLAIVKAISMGANVDVGFSGLFLW